LNPTRRTVIGPLSGILPSRVVEKCHEPKVHVQLLMAVKERHSRIIGDEVEFDLLEATKHHDVQDAGGWLASNRTNSKLWRCRCSGWMSSLALRNFSR
jgi:hypothetical protein